MANHNLLEVSYQSVPRTPEHLLPVAESRPLHELQHFAPSLPAEYDPAQVHYAFSNDESAAYFDQSRSRILTPEYRTATNRVAIVIGESSLMSALAYIPEETILVLDKSEAMCAYMAEYINGLQSTETIHDWMNYMGLLDSINTKLEMTVRLIEQAKDWDKSGYLHSCLDKDLYLEAHQLANQKAIIPWHTDIAKQRDMNRLSKVLKAYDAHVTFINLTNVLAVEESFNDAAACADNLECLPVTSHAPILTTSYHKAKLVGSAEDDYIVEATGPFFGLENLKQHGGPTWSARLGSALQRQYARYQGFPNSSATEPSTDNAAIDKAEAFLRQMGVTIVKYGS